MLTGLEKYLLFLKNKRKGKVLELNKYLKMNKNICSYPQTFDTEHFTEGGQLEPTPTTQFLSERW